MASKKDACLGDLIPFIRIIDDKLSEKLTVLTQIDELIKALVETLNNRFRQCMTNKITLDLYNFKCKVKS